MKEKIHDHACTNCFADSGPCTGECHVADINDKWNDSVPVSFSVALSSLKDGKRIARTGWNGLGMHLQLVKPPQSAAPHETVYTVEAPEGEGDFKERMLPWIGMKTADNCFVPWLASQTDLLSDDWLVI